MAVVYNNPTYNVGNAVNGIVLEAVFWLWFWAYDVCVRVSGWEPRTIAMARKKTQSRLNSFLVAASARASANEVVEAEIRYLDALRSAEKDFGPQSDQAMLVSSILAAFYRSQNRITEAEEIEARLRTWQMLDGTEESAAEESQPEKQGMSSLIRPSGGRSDQNAKAPVVKVPANLRRECQILGLSTDEVLTESIINRAWKKQMLSNSAHPDLGGNTDEAVLLNKAKEALMNYLAERAPKLGKQFNK